MLFSNLEYIPMRMARKFLFRDEFLLRFGRLIPHYRVNRNQADPRPLVADYARYLAASAFAPSARRVLEIGVGATNSTGYEFAARFSPCEMLLLEPFVAYAPAEDEQLLQTTASRHRLDADRLRQSVRRLRTLDQVPAGSVDLVLSSSVLEHVLAPETLFRELRRILRPHGAMLHLVDYRDHFFKYPYHFLQFSKKTWERYLNPGDLPRWRVYDHLEALERTGFQPELLHTEQDEAAFAQVAARISEDFRRTEPLLAVGFAALWAVPTSA